LYGNHVNIEHLYISVIIHLKYDFLSFLVIVAVIKIKYDVVMGDHLESKNGSCYSFIFM